MSDVRIRRAVAADTERLSALSLSAKAHWGYSQEQLAAWRSSLSVTVESISARPVFVGEVDGQAIGFYSLMPSDGMWELDNLWVHPQFTRKGFGRKLLEHAQRTAAEANARSILIDADPNAEPFYVACGAIRHGAIAAPINGEPDRVRPQLTLAVPRTAAHCIRRFGETDSANELTALLHRAFARLGELGLNYTAVDQSVDVTRSRIARGECYVAELDGALVGTVLVENHRPDSECEWFASASLASAHQLAVDPALQGQGIGSGLMNVAEQWAMRRGYRGICIDTAEPATELIRFYAARGYEHVGFAHWQGKRYRSVIMRKPLTVSST